MQTVFDFFHIVKNFNDKVVGQIRKDEQRRLIAEGDEKAAKSLKGSRYILTSSKQTPCKEGPGGRGRKDS
ncbi:transposase [Methanospirillum sp.]